MGPAEHNLPVNVIGGYLGSGKTTLINRLLGEKGLLHVAVLVNDFGSLNIDAALIDSVTDRTIALTNGCICCLLGDDLGIALAEVTAVAAELDHVLLEASGVADGVRLSEQIRAWPGFELRSTLTLVDASRIRELVVDKYVGRHVFQQLRQADLLVLSRQDQCSFSQLDEVRSWMAQHNPRPLRSASDIHWSELSATSEIPRRAELGRDRGISSAGTVQTHPQLRSVTFRQPQPIERECFADWLNQVAGRIQRAKGWIVFSDQPGAHYLLQMVGDRLELTDRELPPGACTALVVIAPEIDSLPDPFRDQKTTERLALR